MPPRLTSISADLGALKAPWVAWCAKQKIKPSDALRQILTGKFQDRCRVCLS